MPKLTPPIKLCKDCRFFIPATLHIDALCGHDSAVVTDFVNGNHTRHRAGFVRQTGESFGHCGPDASFFETKVAEAAE